MSASEVSSDCDPIVKNSDVKEGLKAYKSQTILNPDDVAIPCGLVAKSFFDDSYVLTNNTGNTKVAIDENGIAWDSDRTYKFKN